MFTLPNKNGIRIDLIRNYIDTLPSDIKPFILAPLIVKSSIHNNTNGQFSAFYKDGNIGAYGGAKGVDVKRITTPITIEPPLLIIHAKFSFLKMTQIIGLLKYHLLILFITTLHTTNIHIIFIISYLILLPNGTKLLKYPIHIEVNLKTGKNPIITHPLKLLTLLLI